MNVKLLVPAPTSSDSFRRSRERFIPNKSGCYAITTVENEILYVGLTVDLRRRFIEHLDTRQKTELTIDGRAVFFHWIETNETHTVERTWLNIYQIQRGRLPVLNSMQSPTST